MKLSKLILLIFLLGLCTPLAFAQGQVFKYVPQAVSKGTKTIPAPINPKLPPNVRANFAMPVVRPNISVAVQRTTATKVTKAVTTPPVVPVTSTMHDTGTNLTDIQVLAHYYPAWRQELGGMFSKEQLDAIEQAFATTDDWIFLRGEDGELTVRNPDEWDYQARFLTILTRDSGISFTDKQIKQLIGGSGIKGFTFNRYFTLKKVASFCYAYGRVPRQSIQGKDGKSLTLSDLRKRAEEGDVEAAALAKELELGKQVSTALQSWPQDLPERTALNTLYQQFRNTDTHAQVLAKFEQFTKQHGRAPRQNIKEDGRQLSVTELRRLAQKGDSRAAILAKELELGKQISNALQSWPKDWPEYKKLNTLYRQFRNRKAPETPAQVLAKFEQFIKQYGRAPRSGIQGKNGKLLTLSELRRLAEEGDPEATILAEELELGHQVSNALQNWPKDWPAYKKLKRIWNSFHK